MGFQSGKRGSAFIVDSTVKVEDFAVDPKPDVFDYSNGDDGIVWVPGLVEFEFEMTIGYDPADQPYVSCALGQVIGPVYLYPDKAAVANTFFSFSSAVCTSAPFTSKARGKQTITAKFKGFGTVTVPTA